MLAWAIVLGLLFGLAGAGEYPEDRLRVLRNHINERSASGDIVLVGIDEKSVGQVSRWPWPRGRYAELVDAIAAAKPQQQIHDIMFPDKSDPRQDRQLAAAIGRSSNVTLAYLPRVGAQDGKYEDVRPLPELMEHAGIGTIGLQYNYANEAWFLPRGTRRGETVIPSLASIMADRNAGSNADFRVNYAFDPSSIPTYSAADVMAGRVGRAQLQGKTVIVGTDAERLGDQFMLPGWGKASGVYLHI
ncbi:MAG: CHASE2 domain-containing protein, partial [Sphingomicrobium sp.]